MQVNPVEEFEYWPPGHGTQSPPAWELVPVAHGVQLVALLTLKPTINRVVLLLTGKHIQDLRATARRAVCAQ